MLASMNVMEEGRPIVTMVESKNRSQLSLGSHVEITGEKYHGHYVMVTGFTRTGQCQIEFDVKQPMVCGAILTKNSKTRCTWCHVYVVQKQTNVTEMVLIAQLIALKLKSSKFEDLLEDSLLWFIALVCTYMGNEPGMPDQL
jgi:hypothetical protein